MADRLRAAALLLAACAACCSSPDADPGDLAAFGQLEDPLTGPVEPGSYAAALPTTFLVGAAEDCPALLRARAAQAAAGLAADDAGLVTIVDVSALATLALRDFTDGLLTEATLGGGSVLLDAIGGTVRSLRGEAPGPWRVQVSAAGRIVERRPVEAPGR